MPTFSSRQVTLHIQNGSALANLTKKDLGAAENYARGLKTPGERSSALAQIATALAQKDPEGALEWARNLDPSEGRSQHLVTAISAIAIQKPQKAAGLLGEIDNYQSNYSVIIGIANNWVQKDLQGAIAWLDTLPASQTKMQAYQTAAQQLGSTDPLAGIELVEMLPGNFRKNVLPHILNQWVTKDFDAAKNWITTQDDPMILNAGISTLINTWAQRDPAEAATFLRKTPATQNRHNEYNALANQWAQYDPTALSQWIDELPVGKPRDQATEALVKNVQQVDPASVFDWADTINDQDRRYSQVCDALVHWKRTDPEAARAAANSANLTDEQRKHLLDRLK